MPRHVAGGSESHWSVAVHGVSACHCPPGGVRNSANGPLGHARWQVPSKPWRLFSGTEVQLRPPRTYSHTLAGSLREMTILFRPGAPLGPATPGAEHGRDTRRPPPWRYKAIGVLPSSGARYPHKSTQARELCAKYEGFLSQVIRKVGGVAPLCDVPSPLGTGISRMWPCSGRQARSRRLAEHPRCQNPPVYAPPAPLRRPLRPCLPRTRPSGARPGRGVTLRLSMTRVAARSAILPSCQAPLPIPTRRPRPNISGQAAPAGRT